MVVESTLISYMHMDAQSLIIGLVMVEESIIGVGLI